MSLGSFHRIYIKLIILKLLSLSFFLFGRPTFIIDESSIALNNK